MIVTLNSTQLANEPKGLKNATFSINRGEISIGASFISDVEFWGDGYAILMAAAQGLNPCEQIAVVVDNECGFVFNGLIRVRDIQFDKKTCIATAAIEDNSLQAQIENNLNLIVRFGQSTSITGDSITPYAGVSVDFGGSIGSKQGFRLLDSIQYVANYLTGGITIAPDPLFSTDYLPSIYEIECTRTIGAPAGLVTLGFRTIYGESLTPVGTVGTSVITDDEYADRIAEILQGVALNAAIDGRRPFEVSTSANIVTVKFWNDGELQVLNDGGMGALVVTEVQSHSYGIQNVFISSAQMIDGSTSVTEQVSTSIGDLFALLDLYGIKRVYTSSGLSLMHESNTFDATPAVTISGVDSIQLQYNQPIAAKFLNFAQANNNIDSDQTYLLVKDAGYSGLSCAQSEKNYRVPYKYAFGEIETSQEGIFVFEVNSGVVATYNLTAFDGGSIVSVGSLRFASGLHPFVAKNNVFGNPEGLRFGSSVIANTAAIQIQKQAVFDYPLSNEQINLIRATPLQAIVFDSEVGYIQSIEYNIQTGMTTFNLLTE